MLPPTSSPIHILVSSWWNSRPPAVSAITDCRVSLFMAATGEILRHKELGRVYDPLADNRFKWAAQWLDLADRTIHAIDPAIALSAEFIFNPPPPLSRQHAAAGGDEPSPPPP